MKTKIVVVEIIDGVEKVVDTRHITIKDPDNPTNTELERINHILDSNGVIYSGYYISDILY